MKIDKEDFTKYRASGAVGIHALRDFVECGPKFYFKKHISKEFKDVYKPEFVFGRAAHKLILEGPEEFRRFLAVDEPINENTGKPYGKETKAYAAWREQTGLDSITKYEYANLLEMRDSIQETCPAILTGEAEVTFREDGKPARQCRADKVVGDTVYDLKTCTNLNKFPYEALRFGYQYQAEWYKELSGYGKFLVVAIEKVEPFRCGVFQFGEKISKEAWLTNELQYGKLSSYYSAWKAGTGGWDRGSWDGIQTIEGREYV